MRKSSGLKKGKYKPEEPGCQELIIMNCPKLKFPVEMTEVEIFFSPIFDRAGQFMLIHFIFPKTIAHKLFEFCKVFYNKLLTKMNIHI